MTPGIEPTGGLLPSGGRSAGGGGPPAGGGGSLPPAPAPPPDGNPYRIDFVKEWSTYQRQSLFAAAQEFFRAWHPQRGNMRLKGRRPREVEVRVVLETGDVLRLYFAGHKTIDELLRGRHELIEKQLRRAGLDPAMLKPSTEGGALASVQFAVSGLYPKGQEAAAAAGKLDRVQTGVKGRIAAVRRTLKQELAAAPDDQDLQKIVLLQAELGALSLLPKTNREAMQRFRASSVYAAEQRLAALGPRGAYQEAVKLSSQTGAGVELRVQGERIPLSPQVAPGDTAAVQTVHRRKQDADVEVLRSARTGRFVSAVPDAAKLRLLERARREGFSKVARETGIKRTTLYEWRKLEDR